jgi:hypothetical protein
MHAAQFQVPYSALRPLRPLVCGFCPDRNQICTPPPLWHNRMPHSGVPPTQPLSEAGPCLSRHCSGIPGSGPSGGPIEQLRLGLRSQREILRFPGA